MLPHHYPARGNIFVECNQSHTCGRRPKTAVLEEVADLPIYLFELADNLKID
jgi:hypothetical protein